MSTSIEARRRTSFRDDVQAISTGRTNILALSGGGYRGLFGAHLLAKIEKDFSSSCRDKFQLLAGTSIGGIVASALAVGVPAVDIYGAFKEHGSRIFPEKFLSPARGFFGAKYAPGVLRGVVAEILGDFSDKPLGDIEAKLLLPTLCVNDSTALMLKSGGLVKDDFSSDISLLEAALATSAAPTYFPSQSIKKRTIVDGGLVANAPDSVALIEALRSICALDKIHMLSIGTCGKAGRKVLGPSIQSGKLGWVAKHGLVDLTLSAQEALSVDMMQTLLRDRYLRIDALASEEEQDVLGLDRADAKATQMLEDLAARAHADLKGWQVQSLGDFFR